MWYHTSNTLHTQFLSGFTRFALESLPVRIQILINRSNPTWDQDPHHAARRRWRTPTPTKRRCSLWNTSVQDPAAASSSCGSSATATWSVRSTAPPLSPSFAPAAPSALSPQVKPCSDAKGCGVLPDLCCIDWLAFSRICAVLIDVMARQSAWCSGRGLPSSFRGQRKP